MKLIGYARVSTEEQSLDLQTDALKSYGCEKIFSEKCSGTKPAQKREQFLEMLEFAEVGDCIVIWKLDRLARSLKDLLAQSDKFKERELNFVSLTEKIDTSTPTGRLVFHVFSALAEFERDLISQRVSAGVKAAKERGKPNGRPTRFTNEQKLAMLQLYEEDNGLMVNDIARLYNCSKPSVWNYIKEAQALVTASKLVEVN